MRMGELRIPVVLLSFGVALGAFYGVQRLLYREQVAQPLEEAFRAVAGVQAVQVTNGPRGVRIAVELGPVEDFQATYGELERVATETAGTNWQLEVLDRRGPLDELYYRWHFVIQQGIATGRFENMIQELDRRAAQAGVDRYRVHVGPEAVYVQIHAGEHYLYERVPRPGTPVVMGAEGSAGD